MAKFNKILYIITLSELGGAQRYVLDLVKHFKNINYDIIVASGQDGYLIDECKKNNIQTHVFHHLVRQIHPIKDFIAILEIYSLIKKEKPEMVHLNSSKAGAIGAIAAKMAGVKKVIYTVHGYVFLEPMPRWKKMFYIFIEKFSSYFKDAIICVSNYDKKIGIQYNIAPEKKIVTIHNGIDTNAMNFLAKKEAKKFLIAQSSGLRAQGFWIGTIANFYPTKGLLYLISAAKKIVEKFPDALFIIIGDGDERKILENEIVKLSLEKNVILTGKIPDASKYLRAFDIYVCSSVKEGLPYSILEAMAAGLPIVSTNVGGAPELLKNNSGILVEPKNPLELAIAIIKVLEDSKLAQGLSQNAKKFVENEFSLEKMLEKTERIYLHYSNNEYP